MNIDWSKAPKGFDFCLIGKSMAEHPKFYIGEVDRYVSQSGSFVAYVDAGEFHIYHRPTPSWTGEGKPPVGTLCEYRSSKWPDGLWEKRTVRYASDYHVVTAESDGIERSVPAEIAMFRPIRTPEQIAAEELEKQVQDMVHDTGYPASSIARAICNILVSKGYRKSEIVDEQP